MSSSTATLSEEHMAAREIYRRAFDELHAAEKQFNSEKDQYRLLVDAMMKSEQRFFAALADLAEKKDRLKQYEAV